MKKLICIILALSMLFVLAACGQEEEPKETEVSVSNEDFYKLIKGQWESPDLGYDYMIRAYMENNRYIISLDLNGIVHRTELESVTHNESTDVYTVNLKKMEEDLKINALHITFFEDEGIAHVLAENIYCNNEQYDFMHTEDDYTYYPMAGKTYRANEPGVRTEYQPCLVFGTDGTLEYTENAYEGLFVLKGEFSIQGTKINVYVYENPLYGFRGGDLNQMYFTINEDLSLTLNTDVCMSYEGMQLYQVATK